uniref:hypothetical protein n=1 Tax=Salmonella sp. SAL4432 TaxID=3159887 RepID=UPI003979C7E8
GLGNGYGGIGVVSQMIHESLKDIAQVVVWRNPIESSRIARRAKFVAGAYNGATAVLYEHIDLARVHRHLPGLRHRPYAVFVHGREVWY